MGDVDSQIGDQVANKFAQTVELKASVAAKWT